MTARRFCPLFLVPIAMIMGYFIVKAEPAVYVLNKQVEEITDGAISSKAMGMGLSLGVAARFRSRESRRKRPQSF